ncbi:hypothetical protein [uncultured Dysgonomonas sp.]|uniref:Uncharacterized protein n=1 Tax=uncultured Dysgonomonas sp. TaxID=206096 RepID=A0A212K628_9BACT|nr:hypothetical protein [uncultured Dysgonomonas sp.]SBW07068.1 conserved hypothetical protein [uncultured Dysgonomonas sp.]
MAKKTINVDIEINTKKAEEAVSKFGKFLGVEDILIANFYKHSGNVIDNIGQIATASAEVAARVEALNTLNLKAFGTVEKLNEARMQALVAEIEAEAKKGKAIEQTNALYKEKEQLLIEQSETAKKKLEKEYALIIESAKKTGADITIYDKQKNDSLAALDKKLKEDLKKNNEEHFFAQKTFVDKGLKETTELLTKNIYHGKQKLDKDSEEKIKRLNKEAAKKEEILKNWNNEQIKNSQANMKGLAEIEDERRARAEAIETIHRAKMAKINEDAAKKAKETSDEAAKETVKQAEDTAKKTEEVGKKAENSFKGIINVGEMSRNIEEGLKYLKHYDDSLTASMIHEITRFNQLKETYKDDKEMVETIGKEKAAILKKYTDEKIRIEEMITTAEKKEQGLRLEQMKQYAAKGQEITNSIKGALTQTADYLGTAFTAISSVYKAEVEAIDEDIKHLKAKNDGIIKEAENRTKVITDLEAKLKEATETNNGEAIRSLTEKLNAEKSAAAESIKIKEETEKKEKELTEKKLKKQAEQEKIEKLNRKATLIKNIGEAIANVAQGATKALSYGPILGPILAAVVTAAGAIQVGIMTKQLAKFADGGLLNGKRHAQGGMRIEGTNIEVEGGEYVINRESTSKNLSLVRYINSQRKELTPTDVTGFFARASQGFELPFQREFAAGGMMPPIETPNTIDNEALIDAIKSIKINSRVAVTDIIRAQENAVQVDRWSGN